MFDTSCKGDLHYAVAPERSARTDADTYAELKIALQKP